ETDPARAGGRVGDEELRRSDDLVAAGVVLADPGLVVAARLEVLDQTEVAMELLGRVLVVGMERREEHSEAKGGTRLAHPSADRRSPVAGQSALSGTGARAISYARKPVIAARTSSCSASVSSKNSGRRRMPSLTASVTGQSPSRPPKPRPIGERCK